MCLLSLHRLKRQLLLGHAQLGMHSLELLLLLLDHLRSVTPRMRHAWRHLPLLVAKLGGLRQVLLVLGHHPLQLRHALRRRVGLLHLRHQLGPALRRLGLSRCSVHVSRRMRPHLELLGRSGGGGQLALGLLQLVLLGGAGHLERAQLRARSVQPLLQLRDLLPVDE